MSKATIIIPAYNEEQGIERTIGRLNELLKKSSHEFEVIFVDDGSTDDTYKKLKESEFKFFRVIRHKINAGYGAALKTGVEAAANEIIVITDADGTYPVQKIPELIDVMVDQEHDMVVGSREGRKLEFNPARIFAKYFLHLLANYLTSRKIPDINSGLRIMNKKVVERFINILPEGFSFTTTITLAMLSNSYSVKYVPINYKFRRGKSKINPFADTLNFFALVVRTVMYFNPLKIFLPLSFFFLLLGFAILILSYIFTEKIMDVTCGIILMTSVLILSIGMLADLIDKRMK